MRQFRLFRAERRASATRTESRHSTLFSAQRKTRSRANPAASTALARLPEIYASASKTPLRRTILRGEQAVDLELQRSR